MYSSEDVEHERQHRQGVDGGAHESVADREASSLDDVVVDELISAAGRGGPAAVAPILAELSPEQRDSSVAMLSTRYGHAFAMAALGRTHTDAARVCQDAIEAAQTRDVSAPLIARSRGLVEGAARVLIDDEGRALVRRARAALEEAAHQVEKPRDDGKQGHGGAGKEATKKAAAENQTDTLEQVALQRGRHARDRQAPEANGRWDAACVGCVVPRRHGPGTGRRPGRRCQGELRLARRRSRHARDWHDQLRGREEGDILLGAGHTHPYDKTDGGDTGVAFSGADLARLVYVRERVHVVQSGDISFMVVKTDEFDDMIHDLDDAALDDLAARIQACWSKAFDGAKGTLPERTLVAVEATCTKFHLGFYCGRGGTMRKE